VTLQRGDGSRLTEGEPSMSGPSESASLTMTVDEAARILGISRNSAYEAVRRNQIPSIRIGRRILIPRHRFLRWLEASDTDPADTQP